MDALVLGALADCDEPTDLLFLTELLQQARPVSYAEVQEAVEALIALGLADVETRRLGELGGVLVYTASERGYQCLGLKSTALGARSRLSVGLAS